MANATRIVDRPRHYMVGKYTGTTAAQNIHIGFKPALLIIWNQTDGDDVNFWCKDSETTFVNMAAAAATVSAAVARIDNGTEIGFSLASNSDINEDAKVYIFLALYE